MEKIEIIHKMDKSIDDFGFFIDNIFSQSIDILKEGKWTGGQHPQNVASFLQNNKKTMRVSARDHFKSMSFYAHIMWKLLRMMETKQSREIQYFSYGQGMAAYHLAKLKTAIICNPFYDGIIDLNPQAQSILSYAWEKGSVKLTVHPRGLLEFKRGIHCDDVYVDDPFQDPENKLIPTKIKKINEVMKTQVLDMFQQELHVVGTAQTQNDFFFDVDFSHRFEVRVQPAILDQTKKDVLWEEWMPYDELMAKKKERGLKVFNQEYLCSPVYSEEAFVEADRYDACVNKDLINYDFLSWEKLIQERRDEAERNDKEYEDLDCLAGFDIGKKAHPSHFAVFEKRSEAKWTQIHSKWMDRWDYTKQIEYIERAQEAFQFYSCPYDSTRGEMESLDEQGKLPAEMDPVSFTFKKKHAMAANFDKALSNNDIQLLPESRQRNQILCIDNDLNAPETPEGHGDAFWSICLALRDYDGSDVDITII